MRLKIIFLLVILCQLGYSQIPDINFVSASILSNKNGTSVMKGDTVEMYIEYKGNNSHTRTIFFDFQYNYKTYTIIDVTVPSSALGNGASANVSNNNYQGYSYRRTSQNYTRNGSNNYSNCAYNYSQTSPNAIYRSYVSITSNPDIVDGDFLKIRLKVNNVAAGYSYDSLYMNFAATWDKTGNVISSNMPDPRSIFINLDASANSLVTGNLYMNQATPYTYLTFVDSTSGTLASAAYPDVAGNFKLGSELKSNTTYKVSVFVDSLSIRTGYAVTVSDATAALNEFANQNIDGTYNNTNIMTGVGYLASDVNYNGKFDGADPYLLLAQVAGTNSINTGLYLMQRDSFNVLSTNNWNKGIKDYIYFHTSDVNQNLNLNFLIAGDINRSHSSQVIAQDGTIKAFSFVNTPIQTKTPIVVSTSNAIVNSDYISIPFSIDAGNTNICGLQFEIVYDSTKLQLDTLQSNTNASWLNFYKNANGKLKFGGIDKTLKEALTGKIVPFVAKFKAKTPGVDINTNIAITDNMDASDNKGNQLGINLTNSIIRVIGINNFK
jgi:hypothetical protein